MDGVRTAAQDLQLVLAQAVRVCNSAIDFAAQRQARAEVVHQRKAARVYMPVRGLNTNHAGAGVPRKQESEVQGKSGLVAERFLHDGIEPVISQAGAQLLMRIAGWKLNVQAGRERWRERSGGLAEVPFQTQVRVADAARALRFRGPIDGKIGKVH